MGGNRGEGKGEVKACEVKLLKRKEKKKSFDDWIVENILSDDGLHLQWL